MATATMMTSPAMQRKANELLTRSDSWARGYRKSDGLQFVVFASQSAPGVYYQTRIDGRGCTCKSYLHRGKCCHAVAAAAKYSSAQARPKRTYAELFGADDDSLTSPF